ncbi:MAG: YeeE/YedE family protein [Myxococcales bacterium]|nr:YeeE/YedE family protein [Myxococcales bacterium]
MMPLRPDTWVGYAFAIVAGFAFGFVLERAGFGSSRKLAAQFYLRDMTVLKVMFTAIVTAMLGLTLLTSLGLVDFAAIFVNPTYLGPQIVGGLIFGVGFAVGGYCPGTSIVAAVTGKMDAVSFLLGFGGGVLVFAGAYPLIGGFAQSGSGERRLLSDWLHLPMGVVAVFVVVMALGMFAGAEWLERWMRRRDARASEPPAESTPDDQAHAPAAAE